MKFSARYLIFYVILAIGLALSWGQVGKRTQLVASDDLRLLNVEAECSPWHSPCAAFARDFALVLGPDGERLRLIGESLPATDLRLQQFDQSSHELDTPDFVVMGGFQWSITPVSKNGRLRVTLYHNDIQWIAEYPLGPPH